MGKKAGRRRRRPRGPCSGTGPPSSRPTTGAGQETEAGPPWAPTPTPARIQSWKTGESFPRPHLRAARWPRRASPRPGTSTRPPLTAPGWWPRRRDPGASALCPAAGAPVELVRARPGTTEWSAPGRQLSAGPCQEPQGAAQGAARPERERGPPAEELGGALRSTSGSGAVGTAGPAAPAGGRGSPLSPHVILSPAEATTPGRGLRRSPAPGGGVCRDGAGGRGSRPDVPPSSVA